jgi:hypothetical protein
MYGFWFLVGSVWYAMCMPQRLGFSNREETIMSTTTTDRTATQLLKQWQENTGWHMLDSGGHMGRNWERNQGKTLESFTEAPEATIEPAPYGYVTVNTFQYLLKHLEATADSEHLTAQFRAWVESMPEGEAYYNSLGSAEEWLESIGAQSWEDWQPSDRAPQGFNTYNWENSLDSVLQGVEFSVSGVHYVALSYHGGADVRGGYTDYVVYEACDCWLYNTEDVTLACTGEDCEVLLDLRGDQDGTDKDIEIGKPCPECGSDFKAYVGECTGY